jgi:hypothetical protein
MKRALLPLLLAVSLVVVSAAPAAARGWHGHRGGHGGWWPGAVVGGLVLGALAVATAPFWAVPRPAPAPAVIYAPPVAVAPPPVVYAPAAAYAAPPAPAVQREVVYPNGKYVLYGDGVRQPWQWVWVPAAPPPPLPPQP